MSTVTARMPVAAYYSGYAGQPVCNLLPGETARVVKEKVPAVCGRKPYFMLVEFEKYGQTWRAALWPGQYRFV